MGRVVDDVRLQDRATRTKLKPRCHPYWRFISEGCHLGLYKGVRTSTWIARYRQAGAGNVYQCQKLGEVGDGEGMIVNDDTILDWNQALQKAQIWFRQKAGGGPLVVTVQAAVEQYIAMRDARESNRAGRTVRSNASHRLGAHVLSDAKLMKVLLASLSENDLRAWQDRQSDIQATTLRRLISDLKAALNMAYTRYRSTMPADLPVIIKFGLKIFDNGRTPNPIARENQILSDDEVRRIIGVAGQQDSEGELVRVVVLLAATGARFSQIAKLSVGDVQSEHSRLIVPKSLKGRSKEEGYIRVPVGEDVLKVLRPAMIGRSPEAVLLERWYHKRVGHNQFERDYRAPWKAASDFTDPWKKIVAASDLPGIIPYSLRHSSIVRGLSKGLPIRLVAALHDTSVVMIERHYSRWITEGLDELAARAVVPLVSKT